MDRFEEAVLEYVSANPDCLLKSQMHLPYNEREKSGGSLPDFVVLNFRLKCVYVVEVTTASNTRGIINKVSERETRWYNAIREYDAAWVELISSWDYRVCLFLREQMVEKTESKLSDYGDVSVKSLNEILYPWSWKWDSNNVPINELQ